MSPQELVDQLRVRLALGLLHDLADEEAEHLVTPLPELLRLTGVGGDHRGHHGFESTRGVINETFKENPILRGVADIWVPTDVYVVSHLPKDAKVLVWGQVLSGMKPADPPVEGAKNHPMMPVVWLRDYTGEKGKTSKVLTTTMGAAVDLENEGLRRLLINGAYWAVGLEKSIPAKADVDYVGDYKPGWFGFGKFKPGLRPQDLLN